VSIDISNNRLSYCLMEIPSKTPTNSREENTDKNRLICCLDKLYFKNAMNNAIDSSD